MNVVMLLDCIAIRGWGDSMTAVAAVYDSATYDADSYE